ncbi:MAG: NlpC/P60 family protein [Gammaproteobacteria bacterium]|nr:NlpC/P60 family protein [Gammaproteobacteria bacterium]
MNFTFSIVRFSICLFILFFNMAYCATMEKNFPIAITQEIPIENISGYIDYPEKVKQLISKALLLSEKNLTYLYGSSDPKNGGMDCSGTIYYLLSCVTNLEIPRQANELYLWIEKKGELHYVTSNDFNSVEFNALKPGDLLFWSGTYETHRTPNITHVMLYLGKNKSNEPIMFGSSDGRTYENKKMRGVSVFDFKLPNEKDKARFVAYGCIPSFTC